MNPDTQNQDDGAAQPPVSSNLPCPFCGSEQLLTATPDYIWWRCGTRKYSRFGTDQSITCRNIERDALKARIKQLEEAVELALKMRSERTPTREIGCAEIQEALLRNKAYWDRVAEAVKGKV